MNLIQAYLMLTNDRSKLDYEELTNYIDQVLENHIFSSEQIKDIIQREVVKKGIEKKKRNGHLLGPEYYYLKKNPNYSTSTREYDDDEILRPGRIQVPFVIFEEYSQAQEGLEPIIANDYDCYWLGDANND